MLRKSSQSHRLFLSGCYSQSVFLDSVTSAEIVEIAKSFQSNKTAGYHKIPMSIIKQFINIIAEPLSHILTLSIASGIVPDDTKIACVIPLFKAGDRAIFSNYRPVSILIYWHISINLRYYMIINTDFAKIIQLHLL